jgi:dTDP-4-amino-4,6-dideoxygalactose transaminase
MGNQSGIAKQRGDIMRLIPVFRPLIERSEIEAAVCSLEAGWLGMGKSVGQFEAALKEFIGAADRYVVAVNTGHSALHLAMMLMGIGPGDEVITPSFNNIADFQAILAVGANPVLCDIRDDTLCIDVDKAELLVGDRTKAVIAMDYDCCLADHEAVAQFANRHRLRVLHDAAHAFGSWYKGKKIGSFSDICVFSFDPVKTVTCIDGGALIVKSQAEVDALHEMRLIGMGQPAHLMYGDQRAWTYDVSRLGFRYHMANLHAAIGLAQIAKMPDITASRQAACKLYDELLKPVSGVSVPKSIFDEVTPFLYYIRVPSEKRQALRDHLKAAGIDTGIHWQPGHWFSLLKDARRGDLSVTERVGREILSLPLHSKMDPGVIRMICGAIAAFFNNSSRAAAS